MWLRRVDDGRLSYGAPALPARLHLLPAPVNITYTKHNEAVKNIFKLCEISYFKISPSPPVLHPVVILSTDPNGTDLNRAI